MKGSIHPHGRGYWFIDWFHNGKHERIYKDFLHGGSRFYILHKDPSKCRGHQMAERCLTHMRTDWEAYLRGELAFDLERYRNKFTDVIPYLETWLKTKEGKIMPGTMKLYTLSIEKHLVPFFQRHPLQLHEIQKDTIDLLVSELTCSPKTRKNIVSVLHACLKDACESNRIPKMPGFPKKGDYQIIKKPILWITEAEKDRIFSFIPREHLPVFTFLRLSWRREGEAIALLKADYDRRVDALVIHRGISARQIVERTKDGEIHIWPVEDEYRELLNEALGTMPLSPYLFTCSTSRLEGKRYGREILMGVWKKACEKAGIKIDIHRGLRTSGASSFINELGGTLEEAQEKGQWSNRETLKNFYGRYDIERLRALQKKGKVVQMKRAEEK